MICEDVVYDTEKSTKIAEWCNDEIHTDAHYLAEELYLTQEKTFFLRKIGGAFSPNGTTERDIVYNRDIKVKGDCLSLISKSEAQEWLSMHKFRFQFVLHSGAEDVFLKGVLRTLLSDRLKKYGRRGYA